MKGHICRKGKRWYPVISINGKQKWLKGSDSREGAHGILTVALYSLNQGEYSEPSKILFREFSDQYLTHMKPNLKPSSFDVYNRIVKTLVSNFGDYRLSQVSPFLIDQFITNRKAKPRTINNDLTILKELLDLAIRWGHLKENPLKRVRRLKIPKDEISCLSLEQVNQLLQIITNMKARMIVEIAAFSGMRIGEILALKWSDVNFESGNIHVQRTLYGKSFQSTKTFGRR